MSNVLVKGAALEVRLLNNDKTFWLILLDKPRKVKKARYVAYIATCMLFASSSFAIGKLEFWPDTDNIDEASIEEFNSIFYDKHVRLTDFESYGLVISRERIVNMLLPEVAYVTV